MTFGGEVIEYSPPTKRSRNAMRTHGIGNRPWPKTGLDTRVSAAFIYVACQEGKLSPATSLSFCQAFSLGDAKEKAGGARALAGLVKSLISKFTGCPHLFADWARRRVDTRRERCLHTNEHVNFLGQVHERRSQTAPSVKHDGLRCHNSRPGPARGRSCFRRWARQRDGPGGKRSRHS